MDQKKCNEHPAWQKQAQEMQVNDIDNQTDVTMSNSAYFHGILSRFGVPSEQVLHLLL